MLIPNVQWPFWRANSTPSKQRPSSSCSPSSRSVLPPSPPLTLPYPSTNPRPQFFFNFGANTTTYVYPAEVFPTRFKALAHGTSAAAGKAGAIISALAFNRLSKSVGTPAVLWIFVGCCLAGAVLTLLLPEVKGRDADRLYEEELEAARRAA